MKKQFAKRLAAVGLAAAMAVSLLAGCGGGDAKDGDAGKGKNAEFTWWIGQTDGNGEYYDRYEDNSVAQYVNAQYWDTENGGIGTEENGTKLSLSFLTPVKGEESDNFNTMISTGEYPEILDLAYSSDSPQALYDDGILIDLTEYVEKYMPNYLAYLEENPELKSFVSVPDEDGKAHYYAIYRLGDGLGTPWNGQCYRRDLVVKYAVPTEYVWDWESDYVKENGHPAVTPLEKAVKEDDLEGWKKNEVTEFTADYGENPNVDYTDNVIFPSGTSVPLTISDWEWMFEAFDKAFEKRGWTPGKDAYCVSIPYSGIGTAGALVSSFGGGTGNYYVKDGTAMFDGTSENFKTYLECMQEWYKKGWLDSQFFTRAADMFFMIDSPNVKQGKVGMWSGMSSELGVVGRTTCQNEEDQKDAYICGCALPINDKYGSEEQMYQEPDAMYQTSLIGGKVGITNKAEEKDLAALFTYFDWTYTLEGAAALSIGLSEEQYKSVELDPDMFAEYDLTTAYTVEKQEEGLDVYIPTLNSSDPMQGALMGHRMTVGLALSLNGKLCRLDAQEDPIYTNAYDEWNRYLNTGSILDYTGLLTADEADIFNKANSALTEYQNINVPAVITGEKTWDEYVDGFSNLDPEAALPCLQNHIVK